MSTGSPGRSDPASPAAGSGTLVVELPHWSAEVRVLDNLYQPVTGVLAGEGSDPAVKVSLPPGIYEVEVSLGARSARESVLVRPGRPVTLGREKWASLASTSAAPLAGTDSMREAHAAAAVEWSRKPLRSTSGSDSRLFVFVRTLEPKRYPQFAEGLRLLDADGREVADLSREGRRDAAQGWTAFCADLSAGLYILRRGRSGVRLRQQPVFLSAGWETQVFVAARNRPSLRTLMLNMAPRGAGFTPHDDAAAAAEVAMDALRLGPRGRHVVTGAHMEALLRGEHQNPWLAILAAYALRAR
ncbi:MAG TPA: hypothetical protein VFR37_18460, partial [Longimicrobium sp.]|nr:hypothetical protein [Longimicrobium sp.]